MTNVVWVIKRAEKWYVSRGKSADADDELSVQETGQKQKAKDASVCTRRTIAIAGNEATMAYSRIPFSLR